MTSITINLLDVPGMGKSSLASSLLSGYRYYRESEYAQGYKRGKQDFKRGTKRNLYCSICRGFCCYFGDFERGYQEGWKAAKRERFIYSFPCFLPISITDVFDSWYTKPFGYQLGYEQGEKDYRKYGCLKFSSSYRFKSREYRRGYRQGWKAAAKRGIFTWRIVIINPFDSWFDSWYVKPSEYQLGYEQGKKDFGEDEFLAFSSSYRFESREYRRGYRQGWKAAQRLEQYIYCTNTFKDLSNSLETKEYQLGYRQSRKSNPANNYSYRKAPYSWLFDSKEYKRGYEKGWNWNIFGVQYYPRLPLSYFRLLWVSNFPTFKRIIQELSNPNDFLYILKNSSCLHADKNSHHYKDINRVNYDNVDYFLEKIYFEEYRKQKLENIFNLNKMRKNKMNTFSRGSPVTATLFSTQNNTEYEEMEMMNKTYNKSTPLFQQVGIKYKVEQTLVMVTTLLKRITFNVIREPRVIRELRKERNRINVDRRDIRDNKIADLNRPQEKISLEDNPYQVKCKRLVSYLVMLQASRQGIFKLRAELAFPILA